MRMILKSLKELTPSEQLTWIAFLLTKGQKVVDVDLLSQVTGLPNSTIYRCLRTFKALYWLNKQNKLYTYTVSKKIILKIRVMFI